QKRRTESASFLRHGRSVKLVQFAADAEDQDVPTRKQGRKRVSGVVAAREVRPLRPTAAAARRMKDRGMTRAAAVRSGTRSGCEHGAVGTQYCRTDLTGGQVAVLRFWSVRQTLVI